MPVFRSADDASSLRPDLRRVAILRWWLLGAIAAAVLAAPTLLGIALPQLPLAAVVALMALFNAWVQRRAGGGEDPGPGDLFGQLCVDLAAMGIVLYLSGGAANPLISLLLVPVAVAALSLPGRLAAAVALLAVGTYSLLTWQFLPLAVGDAERATRLHLAGMWLSFVLSVAMIAWFVVRMKATIRERDERLAAAREQALRDERVVALGAMAAGAAHELGTPLATIAVLVGELEHEPCLAADARQDLALVREQLALCKGIISGMAERSGTPRPEQLQAQDAAAWLQGVRARWHSMRPRAGSRLVVDGSGQPPRLIADATLEQAVTNLLNNAADAGDGEIVLRLAWAGPGLELVIADAGPGFPAEVLQGAGRVPLPSTRGGAGIGLLLAFSAIERLGGRIALDNPPGGGGRVRIELPAERIETRGTQ